MDNIRNLLNQVKIISDKNAEILDATGGRFNMFRVCGVNHYENTHSAIIAEFLNPKGSHGLKTKLLQCFIETLKNDFEIINFNCENANVCTEYSTLEGRMDIFIEDNQGKVIIIENKVYAGDQQEQLKRYNKYAEKTFGKGNFQILYLTLDGDEASEQSADGVEYLPISYKETIIEWLDKCVAIATRFPMVRETINQYINHLKYLTNQDMDTKNKEEIVQMIINNRNYLKSAKDISKIWEDCKKEVIKKLIPHIESIAEKLELIHYIDKENIVKCKNGFWFKKPQWDYSILFWFDGGKIGVGIDEWELPQGIKCSEDRKKKLKEFLKDFQIHKSLNNWNWIWGTTFDAWNNCEWEDTEETIPKAIEEITKKILEKLSEFQD
jgi:hypothetical protein